MTEPRNAPTVALLGPTSSERALYRRKLETLATVRTFRAASDFTKSRRNVAFVVVLTETEAEAIRAERELGRSGYRVLVVGPRARTTKLETLQHVTPEDFADAVRLEFGRALALEIASHEVVAQAIVELGELHGLTARQMELIAFWTLPLRRAAIAETLNVEESTVKTRVRILLRRFEASSTDEVAKKLLARALVLGLGARTKTRAKPLRRAP